MRFTLLDRLFPVLFFSPDDVTGTGLGDFTDDLNDLDKAGDADDKPDDDKEKDDDTLGDDKEKDDGSEIFGDGDDDKEDVEEDVEEDEDDKDKDDDKGDDDKDIFQGRPTLTDVKKQYPDIFKKFPELREVIFREQELSKHFGSVEEMEVAATKAGSFDTIEAALLAGDPGLIIDQLGHNAPEALALVVDNFLPKILEKSQDLYLRATTPIVEQFLYTLYEHGKTTADKNLMLSAQHASKFIFGKHEIQDPRRREGSRGPHPAEQKLEEERKTWQQTRFKEASAEVSAVIDDTLNREILRGLDPDKKLSERQRSSLVKSIMDEIDSQLKKDTAFGKQMGSLWKRAGSADYPKDQRASIQNAFLARAKALVPSVRARLRAEWFGEKLPNSGKPKDNKEGQEPPKKRHVGNSGGPAGGGKRPPSSKEVDYSKTSDMDLIEGRFARKR